MNVIGWLACLIPLIWLTIFSWFMVVKPFGGSDKLEDALGVVAVFACGYFWYQWVMYPWSAG